MKRTIIQLALALLALVVNAQTAPSHLKYFGFAIIDCLYDDPLDDEPTTNYISEVESFSNIAQMCVYDYNSNITDRVTLMNNHCVLPIVHIQSIFYEFVDNSAPSGENHDLISDYESRWNTFKTANNLVLDSSKIAAFYIADEPFWNGLTYSDLEIVSNLIKADFPNIPTMLIEASGALSMLEVPVSVNWLGFDEYGIFDPSTNPSFLENLDLLKSKRTDPDQDIFLVIDDQWLPLYGDAGYSPDTIRYMVQNYYNLAVSDDEIIGLLGYLWPGGLDDPEQLGVRNMPQSVIDKNIEIGEMIKANYSPCDATSVELEPIKQYGIVVFPNPAVHELNISFQYPITEEYLSLSIYNVFGRLVIKKSIRNTNLIKIDLTDLDSGLYFYKIRDDKGFIAKGKIIKGP